MLITILSLVLFLIFVILSGFHFYWFLGGVWGGEHVFPTKNKETKAQPIPKFATLIVALGLASIALIYLVTSGLIDFQLPQWINNYVLWFIPVIFILRAIGEFKYVGFFKKIRDTKFAKADTKIFAPLCLFIGVVALLIQTFNY